MLFNGRDERFDGRIQRDGLEAVFDIPHAALALVGRQVFERRTCAVDNQNGSLLET
jgi:hypothetical protein